MLHLLQVLPWSIEALPLHMSGLLQATPYSLLRQGMCTLTCPSAYVFTLVTYKVQEGVRSRIAGCS